MADELNKFSMIHIINNFDFEAVRKAMISTNWVWKEKNEPPAVPSIAKMAEVAAELIDVVSRGSISCSTGGFIAIRDAGGKIRLFFAIAEDETYE